MPIYVCAACLSRGKTWIGDDPRCAFSTPNQTFTENNWNCATLSELRSLLYRAVENKSKTVRIDYYEDQTTAYAFLAKLFEPSAPDVHLALWLTWYKDRGQTDRALLLSINGTLRAPTELELMKIIDHLKNKFH